MGIASANEWSQIEERILQMPDHYNTNSSGGGGGGGGRVMERSGQDNNINSSSSSMINNQVLKCPRCDSSNTKFCYYNNYSLSQPRHFCKACKRYWTRGGTLRNVPVGGGCRKNKRVKKPSSTTSDPQLPPPIPPLSLPNPSQIDMAGSSSDLNPLFYGISNASSDMNLSFPAFRSRVVEHQSISPMSCTAYDLQPQLNALGLSFPQNPQHDQEYPSGLNKNHLTQFQQSPPASAEAVNSGGSSFLHDYTFFGSSLSSAAAASLLASSLKQPKMPSSGFLPFEDLQSSENGNLGLFREVKVEEDPTNVVMNHDKLNWQLSCENPLETIGADFSLYWNTTGGSWPDAAANYGSSVAPLI